MAQEIMLTKEDIHKAIEESQKVKDKYPAFWKFYEMLLEMNQGLGALQYAMEEEEKSGIQSNKSKLSGKK